MSIYQPQNDRPIGTDHQRVKFDNTKIISGVNQTLLVPKGIFFLEYLDVVSGTVAISDGKGNVIVPAIDSFSNDHSPLRCDYGITITGNVAIAKGYTIEEFFAE